MYFGGLGFVGLFDCWKEDGSGKREEHSKGVYSYTGFKRLSVA